MMSMKTMYDCSDCLEEFEEDEMRTIENRFLDEFWGNIKSCTSYEYDMKCPYCGSVKIEEKE